MNSKAVIMKYVYTRKSLQDAKLAGLIPKNIKEEFDVASLDALKFFTITQLDEHYRDYDMGIQLQRTLERTYTLKWETVIKIDYQGSSAATNIEVLKTLRDQLDMLLAEYESGDERHQGIKITEN